MDYLKPIRKARARRWAFLVSSIALAFSGSALADDFHFNQLEITKRAGNLLTLEFQISSVDIFKTLLSKDTSMEEYCETVANMSQPNFDRLLAVGLKKLTANAYLEMPGQQKLRLRNPVAASNVRLRETLQQDCLLQQFPPGMRPHLPTIAVNASVSNAAPFQKVRISMPAQLHPLMVRHGTDQLWLTEQISTAVLDF